MTRWCSDMATNLSASTNPVRRWFKLHTRNCADSLEGLRAQPVATTLTMLVIGIALALPGALNLVVQNGRNLAGSWESARDFSVYLTPGAELAVAEKLATELKKRKQIDSVQIISATDALVEFRESSGLGEVLDSLDSNPLPHTLIVRPKDTATGDQLAEIGEDLDKRPEVDIVKIDTQWVERLNAILDFLNRVVIIATVLLVAAVIIIIGNTIRLDIQNRRDEIEVLKLLGASNGFVRRPFLYVGLWYGLIGGIVALLLMVIGGWLLTAPLEHLIGLYESDLSLLGLDVGSALTMVAGGVLAGWGGAWTAVSRHLAAIQPK
jgi:cell division transport system permease protein